MTHLLFNAAEAGDLARIEARLAAGDDIEYRHKGTGRTALLEAVIAGHPDAVTLLLDRGANPNVSCKAVGHTPIGWAASLGQTEIVLLLLDRGIDPNQVADNTFIGHTPLMLAVKYPDVLQILLDAGADPTRIDGQGNTALTHARRVKNAESVAALEGIGAPEATPPPELEVIPWPKLTWNPYQLEGDGLVADIPADASPAEVLLGWLTAMYTWDSSAWAENEEAKASGVRYKFPFDVYERIRTTYCTDRRRAYSRASISYVPDYGPAHSLVSDTEVKPSRRELVIHHFNPTEHIETYDWLFVLLRKGGLWRIDSAKNRYPGTKKWEVSVL